MADQHRLSPTVDEVRLVVQAMTGEQLKFVHALDPKMVQGRTLEDIAVAMHLPGANDAKRILNSIGKLVGEIIGKSFDDAYRTAHGRSTLSSLLFDEMKFEKRWHYIMAPELYAALVAENKL